MQFVGPGWMNKMGRWEAPYELLKASYEDGYAYYGQLKKEGKLIDMTMAEFADYYRQKKTYTEPECALWRDIVYGSNKQLFWYCDPYMRACVNMDQGGAIVDLRPYAAKLEWKIGCLSEGARADIAIFRLMQFHQTYRDWKGSAFSADNVLKAEMTIKDGDIVYCAPDYLYEAQYQ